MTMQTIHDFEYLNYVMMESLRIQPPAPFTSSFILKQDAKVGDLHLKKDDEFMVNLVALSLNGK